MPYRPNPRVLLFVIWFSGPGCTTPLVRTDAGAADTASSDTGGADAGLGIDTGSTGLDVPSVDAGNPGSDADSSDSCPPAFPAPPTGRVCSMATLTCLTTAMGAAAQAACFAADPRSAECTQCVQDDVLNSCAASDDCPGEIGELECCTDASCPFGGSDCIAANCASPLEVVRGCVADAQEAGRCGVSMLCFPP